MWGLVCVTLLVLCLVFWWCRNDEACCDVERPCLYRSLVVVCKTTVLKSVVCKTIYFCLLFASDVAARNTSQWRRNKRMRNQKLWQRSKLNFRFTHILK